MRKAVRLMVLVVLVLGATVLAPQFTGGCESAGTHSLPCGG